MSKWESAPKLGYRVWKKDQGDAETQITPLPKLISVPLPHPAGFNIQTHTHATEIPNVIISYLMITAHQQRLHPFITSAAVAPPPGSGDILSQHRPLHGPNWTLLTKQKCTGCCDYSANCEGFFFIFKSVYELSISHWLIALRGLFVQWEDKGKWIWRKMKLKVYCNTQSMFMWPY